MHTTDQLNTALAGRYEIERRIGAGGMATVYLARDVKHHRRVALKVLSPELGAVLGPERFLGEIEVTANLHHPHLLPLFDSGEAGGLLFYVMPFIEGETLRARIERERQLTVDESVRITCAIASALDYAHRHGVVHRDLKPENILLHDGQPLVMDFGIALAVSNAGGARITQTGLSLGTPQYMSPEQATGDRQIDGRSDIYSLGAVTYELLTGEPPHTGATVQAIIARVITDRARSMRSTRETIPEHVDAAVLRALAKLPADRFATAMEFAEALSGQRPVAMPSGIQHPGSLTPSRGTVAGSASAHFARGKAREIAAWTLAALATAGLVWNSTRPRPATPFGVFRFDLPDSVGIPGGSGVKLGITRDGSRIVFVGDSAGARRLYLRRADDHVAIPIRGTDTAFNPTFSPRGDWVLFGTGPGASTLRKVPAEGGTPQKIADSVTGRPSWSDDDRIVYARAGTSLFIVNSDGSDHRLLAKPDSSRGVIRFGWPDVLPGSKHALVSYWRGVNVIDSARLGIVSLADGSFTDLGVSGVSPRYAAPGYVLFARPGGLLFAAPFSLAKRRFSGAPSLILEDLWQGIGGATEFSVADNGVMIHQGSGSQRVMSVVRVDSKGVEQKLLSRTGTLANPAISPSGSQVALTVSARAGGGAPDIWMLDMGSSALTRLTSDSANLRPKWTREGKEILFISRARRDTAFLKSVRADGSGIPVVVRGDRSADGKPVNEVAIGPADGYTLYRMGGGNLPNDLFISRSTDPLQLQPFLVTPASELTPHVSPSGRSVVYVTDHTGRPEVYLRPIPGPGAATPVSIQGGIEPVWSRDGKTVFYRTPDRQFMAATIDEAGQRVLSRRMLFRDNYLTVMTAHNYDVFPNGDFVFISGAMSDSRVAVTTDWKRLLQRRLGGSESFERP